MADTLDLTISGTVVSLPVSTASPNWSPAILQAFTLIAAALEGLSGTFDVSPQVLDISAFNTATNENVTNLTFSNTAVRSAIISYYVYRETDSANASESGQIFIDYNDNRPATEQWAFSQETVGNANVSFSITDSGQVRFSTTALAGSSHVGSIGFVAKTVIQS